MNRSQFLKYQEIQEANNNRFLASLTPISYCVIPKTNIHVYRGYQLARTVEWLNTFAGTGFEKYDESILVCDILENKEGDKFIKDVEGKHHNLKYDETCLGMDKNNVMVTVGWMFNNSVNFSEYPEVVSLVALFVSELRYFNLDRLRETCELLTIPLLYRETKADIVCRIKNKLKIA